MIIFSVSGNSINSDSLWAVWNDNSRADTSRFHAIVEIIEDLNSRYPDSAYTLCKMSFDFSVEKENIELQARAYDQLGLNRYYAGEYEDAIYYYDKGLGIADSLQIKLVAGNLYYNKGWLYRTLGQLDEALAASYAALDIAKELHDTVSLMNAYNVLGTVFLEKDDTPNALLNLLEGLRLAEKINNEGRIAISNYTIGMAYRLAGDLEKARNYLLRAKHFYSQSEYRNSLATILNGLGITYRDMGLVDSALSYYNEGLKIAEKLSNKGLIASFNTNIGNIYKMNSDFDKAIDYYQKSIDYYLETGQLKLVTNMYFNMGSLHNKFDMYGEGRSWCEKSYSMAKENNYVQQQMNACECLRDAYKGLGNMALAYEYQGRYFYFRDSLDRMTDNEEIARLEIKYEYEKQFLADSLAMEEEKLRQALAYQESLSEERTQRNAGIIAGTILFILALLLFSRFQLIRKANRQLEEKNKQIEKEKRRAEESERSKEQFFNNISHEFKTPLTLIMGPLDKLISSGSDSDKSELNMMKRNANRLYTMINELLNLYKLESGKISLKTREQDLGEFVRRYVRSFESLADIKNVELKVNVDNELPLIYFESEKMEIILGNLLSNAFKFVAEKGKIEVSVGTGISDTQDQVNGVLVTVKDNGVGIPASDINRIFDRFYQADDNLSRNYEGTGIGLALTKELVELHHGWIKVKSEEGSGAEFKFFIPSGNAHLQPEEIEEENAKTIDITGSRDDQFKTEINSETSNEKSVQDAPLLLIVEDNQDMRLYIKKDLAPFYRLIEADNGRDGYDLAVKKIPDLIISDVMMPGMNGYEMCEKVKSDLRTSHIPVILVTARSSIEHKLEGLETGADDYIAKPFNILELQSRIRNLISQRAVLRQKFSENLDHAIQLSSTNITSVDQRFLEKALRIVEENISAIDFSVEEFAGKMALSRVQLHRKLTALTGQSASRFIRNIRLKRAAEYLAADGANISETAYKFGFGNLSYFGRCFKEEYGMTPREYTIRHNEKK